MRRRSRDFVAHTRVSHVEKQALAKIAEREEVSISEALRLALREAAQARGVWPVDRLAVVGQQCSE